MSSCPIAASEKSLQPVGDRKTEMYESRVSPVSRRSVPSRSLTLDRSSRIGSQEIRQQSRSRDLRAVDRLSRTRVSDDEASRRLRESRFVTIARSRDARNSFDAARSRDPYNRATDRRSAEYGSQRFQPRLADSRLEDRRSRSTERRESNEIARRQYRVERSMDSRNSLNLQRRDSVDRDRRSLSMERRISREINRQEPRQISREHREYRDLARDRADRRSETREHRSLRSVERDATRSTRLEDSRNLLDHPARIARGDIDRNNNLDRRNWERSVENRRVLPNRVANQMQRSSVRTRDSRSDFTRSDDRRSLSRSVDRSSTNDLPRDTLDRRVRSVKFNLERAKDRRVSSERRSLVRSMERRENHLDQRQEENRMFHDRRSLDRATPRVFMSTDHRRRISHSQRMGNQHDSRENRARENSRAALSRSRYDLGEIGNREREERSIRSSRSINSNSADRREFARIRDSKDIERKLRDSSAARDLRLERRERSNHGLHRSREEQSVVRQKSREARSYDKLSERRLSERAATDSARFDSRRLSERKIDDHSKVREASRMADRRLERSPELRISRERIVEKRSLQRQRSSERRIDDSSKLHERSRVADQRLERSRELQSSRGRISERYRLQNPESREGSRMQNRARVNFEPRNSIRMMEHRASSRVLSDNKIARSSDRRTDARRDLHTRSQRERGLARSRAENPDKELIRQHRQRSANLNLEKMPSRFVSLQRMAKISNEIREQPVSSAEKTLSRIRDDNRLSAKWERNLQDSRINRNVEIRTKRVPESLKDYKFLKYSVNYDLMKQALLVALCTIYGFSLYNGKKSYR